MQNADTHTLPNLPLEAFNKALDRIRELERELNKAKVDLESRGNIAYTPEMLIHILGSLVVSAQKANVDIAEMNARLIDRQTVVTSTGVKLVEAEREIARLKTTITELSDELENVVSVGCEFCDMDMGENGSAAVNSANELLERLKASK